MQARARIAGFTLVEITLSIVIISMAAATLVGVMATAAQRSADVMVQTQAAAIADAYLQDVLSRNFPPAMDNVDDYNLFHAGARDRLGNAIAGLTGYQVQVVVAPMSMGPVSAANSRLVTVTVTGPTGTRTLLSGYKMRHP